MTVDANELRERRARDLRGMDTNALYDLLRGELDNGPTAYPLYQIEREIERRIVEGLPKGVRETLDFLGWDNQRGTPVSVAFRVTTDYDDGPAWDTEATVTLADDTSVKLDFDRTGVADDLIELRENGDDHAPRVGRKLVVDLVADKVECR